MNVVGPVHLQRMFTWNMETKTGVVEISDFGGTKVWGRLFDDACDEGFQILTPSGKKIPFYLTNINHKEGDITSWCFRQYGKPGGQAFRIVIFND